MFNQLNNKSTKLIGEQDKRQRREIELFLRDSKLLFEGVRGKGKGEKSKRGLDGQVVELESQKTIGL